MTELVPVTFDEALSITASDRRELLLGNGFSIAASAKFTYRSLLEHAALPDTLRGTFEKLDTTDFEAVLRELDLRASMTSSIEHEAIIRDRDALRDALVAAIADIHPKHRMVMDESRYSACRTFLSHFIGCQRRRGGRVFTTNYDLLLYWSVIPEAIKRPQSRSLSCDDGFMFQPFRDKQPNTLDIVHLHGNLSYFETPNGIIKIRYRPDEPMISQIRRSLDFGHYPVFVSEGTSSQKIQRIAANEYLRYARRRFQYACRIREAAMFTVGHSLSQQDAHIADAIGMGRNSRIFIGIHGAVGSRSWEDAQATADRWSAMRLQTDDKAPLQVFGFDTSGLSIWR